MILPPVEQRQGLVDSFFESSCSYWDRIYSTEDLLARIYQRRQQVTLEWIESLRLPAGARIIDVGCGAGSTAIMLAHRGCKVVAVDRVPAMLQLLRNNASQAGVSSSIETVLGDASALQFPANEFHVTVALGLLPWVKRPQIVLQEMDRVTRPGGHLIISADNAWRLSQMLDPLRNPFFILLWRTAVTMIRAACHREPHVYAQMHRPSAFNRMISAQGLQKMDSRSVGFGPFTLFRRPLFREASALSIDRLLQTHADRKFPLLATTGAHYLILARKLDKLL